MAEGLFTVEGEPIDVDASEAAFAAAMAAPPADKKGLAAPTKRPPEPPADDKAPHGYTYIDGEWRPKKAAGRPKAGDKARVTEAAPAKAVATAKPADKTAPTAAPDYRETLEDGLEAIWFVLASTPVPDQLLGYKLRGLRVRMRAQAFLIDQNHAGLAAGVGILARHNRFVARALERAKAGEGGLWSLQAAMALAPFAVQSAQLWSMDLAELEAMAEKVEAQAGEYIKTLAGEFDASEESS